jgi:hypothetical protein
MQPTKKLFNICLIYFFFSPLLFSFLLEIKMNVKMKQKKTNKSRSSSSSSSIETITSNWKDFDNNNDLTIRNKK